MRKINNPQYIGVRFLDPIGKVFIDEGSENKDFLRVVYPEAESYVNFLLRLSSVNKLFDLGLVARAIIDRTVEVEGFDMILRSQKIPIKLPSERLPFAVRKQMALNWLEININLLKDGFGLIDAHLNNFSLSNKASPVWVDLGSVAKLKHGYEGLAEFEAYFYRPLRLMSAKPEIADSIRKASAGDGVSVNFENSITCMPLLRWRNHSIYSVLFKLLRRMGLSKNYKLRLLVLMFFRIRLSGLSAPKQFWSDYRNGKDSSFELKSPRLIAFTELVEKINFNTCLDIGGNDGYFTKRIIRSNCRFDLVDIDDFAVSKFVGFLEAANVDKSTSFRIWIGSFWDQIGVYDLVIAMALVHHLTLGQSFSFDTVAKKMAELSSSFCITEFMPNGLGGNTKPQDLPNWYTLERFLSALRKYFLFVTVIPYEGAPGSPRVLIFCAKKAGPYIADNSLASVSAH